MRFATFRLIPRSRNLRWRRTLQRARLGWIPQQPTSYSTIQKNSCSSLSPPREQQKDMVAPVVADREAEAMVLVVAPVVADREAEAMVLVVAPVVADREAEATAPAVVGREAQAMVTVVMVPAAWAQDFMQSAKATR